jgi:hypothetical protein
MLRRQYGVALVDNEANMRVKTIKWLRGGDPRNPKDTSWASLDRWRADIIVVHDTEPQAWNSYMWHDIFDSVTKVQLWDPWHMVRTTVMFSGDALRDSGIHNLIGVLLRIDKDKPQCLSSISGHWPHGENGNEKGNQKTGTQV